MIFSSPLPYPSLDRLQPNDYDLQLIRNNYAGVISELSAITQYVYHQLHAKYNDFTYIGSSLLSIAQIEMRHLNIFGTMILKLGGNPKFMYENNCKLSYWNGGMIDDICQVQSMLQSDILLEQKTILCYQQQATLSTQPTISLVLNRIVLDEELHIDALNSLYQSTLSP